MKHLRRSIIVSTCCTVGTAIRLGYDYLRATTLLASTPSLAASRHKLTIWEASSINKQSTHDLLQIIASIEIQIKQLPHRYQARLREQLTILSTDRFLRYCTIGFAHIIQPFDNLRRDIQNTYAQYDHIRMNLTHASFPQDEIATRCLQRIQRFATQTKKNISDYDHAIHIYYDGIIHSLDQQRTQPRACATSFPLDKDITDENIAFFRTTITTQANRLALIANTVDANNKKEYLVLCDALLEYEQRQNQQHKKHTDKYNQLETNDATSTDATSHLTDLDTNELDMINKLHDQADEWIETMWDANQHTKTFDDRLREFFQIFNGKVD